MGRRCLFSSKKARLVRPQVIAGENPSYASKRMSIVGRFRHVRLHACSLIQVSRFHSPKPTDFIPVPPLEKLARILRTPCTVESWLMALVLVLLQSRVEHVRQDFAGRFIMGWTSAGALVLGSVGIALFLGLRERRKRRTQGATFCTNVPSPW